MSLEEVRHIWSVIFITFFIVVAIGAVISFIRYNKQFKDNDPRVWEDILG